MYIYIERERERKRERERVNEGLSTMEKIHTDIRSARMHVCQASSVMFNSETLWTIAH